MAAVAKIKQEETAVVPQSGNDDANSIINMIDKLIARPELPVDKLDHLIALQERMMAAKAKRAYQAARIAMQPELPKIVKRGEGNNSKFPRWEDACDKILPILSKHDFDLSFRTRGEDGKIVVTAVLTHIDGHAETSELPLPVDTSGSKNAVQAIGSSTSYGKRYTAFALLNIVATDEDDDGKAADALEPLSDEQLIEIQALITETRSDLTRFLQVANAESVSDILKKDFPRLKALLLKKKGARK